MRNLRAALVGAACFVALISGPAIASSSCLGRMIPVNPKTVPQRPLEPDDLVRLRDIGASTTVPGGARAFSVSPDGKRVAFQIRRADPDSNGFCLAILVLEIGSAAQPVVLDEGGQLLRWDFEFRGKVGFPSGVPITVTPNWSPDGKWIIFLKRQGPTTQAWRVRSDGSDGVPVTHSPVDVEDLRVTPDGRTIVFATRPELAATQNSIDRESMRGFHYDDRFSPMTKAQPFAQGVNVVRYYAQNLATGVVRPAVEEEQRLFSTSNQEQAGVVEVARTLDGRRAWIIPPAGDEFFWNSRVAAQDNSGNTIECSAPSCKSWASAPWWSEDGMKVRFFRREGWAQSATAVYEWNVDQSVPRRLYSTDDLLSQCDPWNDGLICLREGSIEPRALVQIEFAGGKVKTLFDPNPEFKALTLGRVERLHWQNDFGVESYGDLVYPVGYRPGQTYPLIIVQYETRGFLRGGTGDEYPIQAFANRGFMVLSFQRPRDIGYFRASGESGVDKANLADFADRKSVQSSLDRGIRLLLDRGLVDEKRIGITGLSDGVATVQFALINNPIFAAAA